jgi:hypothetical protein
VSDIVLPPAAKQLVDLRLHDRAQVDRGARLRFGGCFSIQLDRLGLLAERDDLGVDLVPEADQVEADRRPIGSDDRAELDLVREIA